MKRLSHNGGSFFIDLLGNRTGISFMEIHSYRVLLKTIAMAEIVAANNRHERKRNRTKKAFLRIDMTPMVDLGFLLITFFVFTAEISKPHSLNLNMPIDGPSTPVAESATITVLLADNNIAYYYEGKWEDALAANKIIKTNLSVTGGLGDVIRKKQQYLDEHPVKNEKREGLMLLIKPSNMSSYKNVVDALDEALINEVKKYAVVKIEEQEKQFLQEKIN